MTKLVAIITKQVQLQELVACVEHFRITELNLHLATGRGRVGIHGISELLEEFFPHLQFDITPCHIEDHPAMARILKAQADVFAFPIYRSSTLYARVPLLRHRATVVHITDGLGDLFTMRELQRAVLAKTKAALFKGLFVIPFLHCWPGHAEFNLFHPQKSPYASKSLPVPTFPISTAKRRQLEDLKQIAKPEALVIDGFDLTAEAIAHGVGLKRYVGTQRNGGILVNGESRLQDQVICAEEVIEIMRPDLVIGCPSTSLAAARSVQPMSKVFCVITPKAIEVRGATFNATFKKYGERFGIRFLDSEVPSHQLAAIKAALPVRVPACA